jgi:hypothetical protein
MKLGYALSAVLLTAALAFAGTQVGNGLHTLDSTPPGNPHYVKGEPGPPQFLTPQPDDGTGPYTWTDPPGKYINELGFWYEFETIEGDPPLTTWTFGGPGGPTAGGIVRG